MGSLQEMERRAAGHQEHKPSKGDSVAMKVFGGIAILAVAGGIGVYVFVIQPKIDNHQLAHQHGEARGSVISNNVITLIDHVSITRSEKDATSDQTHDVETHRTRLTSVDLATGKQLAQVLVDGAGSCVPATADTLWCNLDGLELYELETLKKVADVVDAIDKAKLGSVVESKELGHPEIVGIVEGSRATLMLDDGRVAIYDAAARSVSKSDDVPARLKGDTIHRRETLKLQPVSSCRIASFGGGNRQNIASSKDTFLGPDLIGSLEPPVFFHHSSLDQSKDRLQLSRLDKSGATAWTVELGGACEQMLVADARLVMTTQNADKRAIAIDLVDGKTAWTTSF